jgi:hypothetical protein
LTNFVESSLPGLIVVLTVPCGLGVPFGVERFILDFEAFDEYVGDFEATIRYVQIMYYLHGRFGLRLEILTVGIGRPVDQYDQKQLQHFFVYQRK